MASSNREDTDLFSTIRLGWFKAVNTYNIVKGSAGFVAYATILMYQHYVKLTRQMNQQRNGSSINAIYIESVHSSSVNDETNSTTKSKMIDNIYADTDTNDMDNYEAKEFIKQKLALLKEHDKVMHDVLVMHYFKNMTQVQIAQAFNRNKTWVARQLRRGRQFLRARIPDEEFLQVMRDLNKKNRSYNVYTNNNEDDENYEYDTLSRNICPKCGEQLDENGWCPNCEKFIEYDYCPKCEERLDEDGWCPNCGEFIEYDCCPKCGEQLAEDGWCPNCEEFIEYDCCPICGVQLDEDGWCPYCEEFIEYDCCPKCGEQFNEDGDYDEEDEDYYDDEDEDYYYDDSYPKYESFDRSVADALDGPEGYYNVYGEWPEGYNPISDKWIEKDDDEW